MNRFLQFQIEGVDENFIEEFKEFIEWESKSGQYSDYYKAVEISKYNHIPIMVETLLEKSGEWKSGEEIKPYWSEKGLRLPGEWHYFSFNKFLTAFHLENFKEKLSWDIISSNESLPLSIELIEKFADKWNWSKIINRNDFSLDIFYLIYPYLTWEILDANRDVIIKIITPEEKTILHHFKYRLSFEYSMKFKYAWRLDFGDYKDSKSAIIEKGIRDFQTSQCGKAKNEFEKIKSEMKNSEEYFKSVYIWLKEYSQLYEEISRVSESLVRERGNPPGNEVRFFFIIYSETLQNFKKEYFKVFQSGNNL